MLACRQTVRLFANQFPGHEDQRRRNEKYYSKGLWDGLVTDAMAKMGQIGGW